MRPWLILAVTLAPGACAPQGNAPTCPLVDDHGRSLARRARPHAATLVTGAWDVIAANAARARQAS